MKPLKLHIDDNGGEGTPLLLISGLGYSSWCWSDLRQALKHQYRIITFDNRGTGRSDKPAGPYSIEMLADDAAHVLDQCKLPTAHVLGHSMGGYIAQTLALRHPQRVLSLVLVCTAAGGADCLPVPDETLEAWKQSAGLSPEQYARSTMPHSFAPGWTQQHPAAFSRYLAMRLEYPTPPECWLAQFQTCEKFFEQGVATDRIQQPSLVIHGKEDQVVPHANGEMLAGKLPNAQFVSLPGQGHLPYLEEPLGFVRLLQSFFKTQNSSRVTTGT